MTKEPNSHLYQKRSLSTDTFCSYIIKHLSYSFSIITFTGNYNSSIHTFLSLPVFFLIKREKNTTKIVGLSLNNTYRTGRVWVLIMLEDIKHNNTHTYFLSYHIRKNWRKQKIHFLGRQCPSHTAPVHLAGIRYSVSVGSCDLYLRK